MGILASRSKRFVVALLWPTFFWIEGISESLDGIFVEREVEEDEPSEVGVELEDVAIGDAVSLA